MTMSMLDHVQVVYGAPTNLWAALVDIPASKVTNHSLDELVVCVDPMAVVCKLKVVLKSINADGII